jgi:ubiquinone/menaquinone biosynthesis C-methylase UbiE
MKTEWDYTYLADAYLKRPNYADSAIDAMLSVAGIDRGDKVCDVGAGAAHLTLMLAARGLIITAVEPNDAMRSNGIKRTSAIQNIYWHEGTGEQTEQESYSFDLVTFGSSFNVCDRAKALKESARILKPKGWFACMWNHRQLENEIQSQIEAIIKNRIPDYGYGSRREDQTKIVDACDLFGPVVNLSSRVIHMQKISECVDAWRSHATLARQAGISFESVIEAIEAYLVSLNTDTIDIPYSTNMSIAQLR